MREFPRGGLLGKCVWYGRMVAGLKIPLYAANASFFMVIAAFPALVLLLGLLRYTPLEVERFGQMLEGILPEVFLEGAEELILLTYDALPASVLGISAVTLLWSASRGIHGVLTGLNGVYGVAEDRGYVYTRLVSVGYTFVFLLVLILTLGLHVFSSAVVEVLNRAGSPVWRFLVWLVDFRFFLLLILQTAVFTGMFMALPNRKNGFWQSLPGALVASAGWLIFSDVYSKYVEKFGKLEYGQVWGIGLSMVWLYCCMSIVFYGGAVNRFLGRKWQKCLYWVHNGDVR